MVDNLIQLLKRDVRAKEDGNIEANIEVKIEANPDRMDQEVCTEERGFDGSCKCR